MTKSPNRALRAWVNVVAEQVLPSNVHWWTGTAAERDAVTKAALEEHPADPTAAIAERAPVLVAAHRRAAAGPTNTWLSCDDAHARVWPMFHGGMRERTMYVVPFLLGAPRSGFCKVGVQVTDSAQVALAVDQMSRAGRVALDSLAGSLDFARGVHCLGRPGATRRLIVHFPETVETWSIGSAALENALFCGGPEGLRLASSRAREEGWLAENMSLFALRAASGPEWHFAAACVDDDAAAELQDLASPDGWTCRRMGGRTTWMRPGPDGRLLALDPGARAWEPATGVPLSAILFCGRHPRSTPIVYEARSWRHGVYVGATLTRESEGNHSVAHDPMSMLAACGYNMGEYFAHWLSLGRKLHHPPKMFHVNWFRTDADGRRLWPGGTRNLRVLQWIAARIEGGAASRESPLGLVPEPAVLESADLEADRLDQLLTCNHAALLRQAEASRRFFASFGEVLPAPLLAEHRRLVRRLQESLH